MENCSEVNRKIAKNLISYRKQAGLTQAELAEKINYSDKSISKWESGNGVPDVYTLLQLAGLYGVTLNDLVGDEQTVKIQKRSNKGLHWLIMLLSSGIVWLVATCVFVGLNLLFSTGPWWLSFIYAVAANAIVIIVYAGIWKYRFVNFISVSTLIWIALTCIYLTWRMIALHFGGGVSALWTIYLLGIPLQILEILWEFFRSLFIKNRGKKYVKASVEETPSSFEPNEEKSDDIPNGQEATAGESR